MDEQFELRRRANKVQSSIEAGTKSVEAAIAYYDRRLGHDRRGSGLAGLDETRLSARGIAGRRDGPATRDDVHPGMQCGEPAPPARVQGGGVVLLPLLLLLAYRSRKRVYDRARDASGRAGAAAPDLRLAAAHADRRGSVFPDAPLVMHQMAMLLALIPVLRLLPQKVFQVLGPWPYVGTGSTCCIAWGSCCSASHCSTGSTSSPCRSSRQAW